LDSLGCLNDVMAKSSLLAARYLTEKPASKDEPKVVLIGDTDAVDLAEKLLTRIHFKNQVKMQKFEDIRNQHLARISQLEAETGGHHKETFTVANAFVGRIIGKKGENIARLRKEFDVYINIQEDDCDLDMSTVTVTGESENSVKKARDQLEYVNARIKVQSDQVGWIIGKGYSNLQNIQQKTELMFARYDDQSQSIELSGLRSQVENAKLMLSVHCNYMSVYQDMSDERKTMQQQFAELERKGVGPGKKGGGNKGKPKSSTSMAVAEQLTMAGGTPRKPATRAMMTTTSLIRERAPPRAKARVEEARAKTVAASLTRTMATMTMCSTGARARARLGVEEEAGASTAAAASEMGEQGRDLLLMLPHSTCMRPRQEFLGQACLRFLGGGAISSDNHTVLYLRAQVRQ